MPDQHTLTVLVVPDCPHTTAAAELARDALTTTGLAATIETVQVRDHDQAARLGFVGSPSFHLDGRDLFGENGAPAMACRVYRTSTTSPVHTLVRDSQFTLHTLTGPVTAARVVVATGAFGTPVAPTFTDDLEPGLPALHSHDYRRPGDVPHGVVLVVGAGNTGYQLALELALDGRTVHLARGTPARTVPQRIAGRDIFWWLTRTGLVTAPTGSRIGRRLRANDPIIGTRRAALRAAGVRFRPAPRPVPAEPSRSPTGPPYAPTRSSGPPDTATTTAGSTSPGLSTRTALCAPRDWTPPPRGCTCWGAPGNVAEGLPCWDSSATTHATLRRASQRDRKTSTHCVTRSELSSQRQNTTPAKVPAKVLDTSSRTV